MFISLHNHTSSGSIMSSLIKPEDLFKRAKELNQSAIAVTDHNSFAGIFDSLKASRETGIKLIVGAEMHFKSDLNNADERLRHIILIAKNANGYKNLLTLNRLAFDNSIINFKKVFPIIDWNLLEQFSSDVLCFSSCSNGILGQLINAKQFGEAEKQALRLKGIFGENFAIELQPNNLIRNETLYSFKADQAFTNKQLIDLAKRIDVKLIATTNAHYVNKIDSDAHDLLLSINSGVPKSAGNRPKYNVPDFYMKSEEEIIAHFSRGVYKNYGENFAQELCDNTIFFADMCEDPAWVEPKFSNPTGKELPTFNVKSESNYQQFITWLQTQTDQIKNLDEDKSYLRYLCDKGLDLKVPQDQHEKYRKRLEEEFDVIEFHGFSSYLLIVHDYINWARRNEIRVGAGRGSVGGALIGYLISVHEADPFKYDLLFARFHNKDKTSYPDIDSDFSPTGRDRVQSYIAKKYGENSVAHISNFNRITPKVYVRDLCRALDLGSDRKKSVLLGTNIADSISIECHSIKSAIQHSPLFGEWAKKYNQFEQYQDTVFGKIRAVATHAAGIVIGKRPLVGLIPLRKDKDGNISVEIEKEKSEEIGLVKMDTLGLETLDIIDLTYKLIKSAGKQAPPDPPNYEEYDKETYDLISRGDTFCVFQLGSSGGTIDLCRKVKPKSIEELGIITALARPAAKEIREPYIKTRNGEEKFELIHKSLERAFSQTLGFPLYEECLMYLAADVAGWELNRADRLRKLTKDKGKHPEKIAQWRKEFIQDAQDNKQIPKNIATKIWDEVVASFGGYAFNKSHAILYSFISYHTAYLKAHFPLEFLVSNLISEVSSNTKQSKDNIIRIKNEIRRLRVEIIPPNINTSEMTYKIVGENKLMTGMDSLKFIGNDAIPEIIAKRPFTSFEDFLKKVDGKKVRAPAVQALAASGCLDEFGLSRKLMYLYASDYKKKLQVWLKKSTNQLNNFQYPWPEDVGDWNIPEKWAMEVNYLGEGLTGGLKDRFPNFFDGKLIPFKKLPDIYPAPKEGETLSRAEQERRYGIKLVKGEIVSTFKFKVKKEDSKILGKTVQKLLIKDQDGTEIGVVLFPDTIDRVEEQLRMLEGKKMELIPGMAISFSGVVNYYEGECSLIMNDLYTFAHPPALPEDREGKKVKMPRQTKNKKTVEEATQDEILEEIEDELIDDGTDIDDEYKEEDFE